jgi:phosphohistidine swiveling domain-containing protein
MITEEKTEQFKKIIAHRWYIQGFNSCANFISHAPESALVGCHKYLGYGYTNKLFIFNKDYLEYHYNEKDFEDIGNEFLKRYLKDSNYLEEVRIKDRKLNDESRALWKDIEDVREKGFENLTKKQSLELYQKAWTAYHKSVDVCHIIEGISFVLEPMLKEKMEKELKMDRHDKEFRSMFNNLMQPSKASFINDEHLEILNITKEVIEDEKTLELFKNNDTNIIFQELNKVNKSIKQKLIKHTKYFFFNRLNYYHVQSLTELDYITEIKQLIKDKVNIEGKIDFEKESYSINNKKRDDIISEHNFDNDIKNLITLSVETLHWQDDRKKIILSGVYYVGLMLDELARLYSIDIEMLKRYDAYEITEELLENFNEKHIEDAKIRMDKYIIFYENKGEGENTYVKKTIILGKEFDEFMKLYNETILEHTDLHGTCASPGKAMGEVRVCRTKEDIEKFKEGEVLVSAMTRPEFISAMRKASAIVTDEGGITCHAAIVSRELGKPCIIGTKVATKILKDGQYVDVNANHGIVKVVDK